MFDCVREDAVDVFSSVLAFDEAVGAINDDFLEDLPSDDTGVALFGLSGNGVVLLLLSKTSGVALRLPLCGKGLTLVAESDAEDGVVCLKSPPSDVRVDVTLKDWVLVKLPPVLAGEIAAAGFMEEVEVRDPGVVRCGVTGRLVGVVGRPEGVDGRPLGELVFNVEPSLFLVASVTTECGAPTNEVLLVTDEMLVLDSETDLPGLGGARRVFAESVDCRTDDRGPRTDVRASVPLSNAVLAVSALIDARTEVPLLKPDAAS